MHSTTIRRGATCAAAVLAFAAMAAPTAQADVTGPVGPLTPQAVPPVNAASVETSVSFMLLPITDPVGSVEMGWQSIDCFVVFPWDGPEDNCWY